MNRVEFDNALMGLSRRAIAEIAWRHYQRPEKAQARIEALEKALQDAYLNGFHAGRTATLATEEKP